MRIDYETPELTEAKFGKFVEGASAPGGSGDLDQSTDENL